MAIVLAAGAGAGWAYWDQSRSQSKLAFDLAGALRDAPPADAAGPSRTLDTERPAGAPVLGATDGVAARSTAGAPAAPVTPGVAGKVPPAAALALAPVAARAGAGTPGQLPVRSGFDSPRAACAPRTDFSLFHCVQVLCENPRWSKHPQCVHLKESGDVD
jgi:non-specific serine/threonine protein kinase